MTPGFTHFFRNFFLTEKAVPQTSLLLECMIQGGPKNVTYGANFLISVLEVRFTLFTCVTESEMRAWFQYTVGKLLDQK